MTTSTGCQFFAVTGGLLAQVPDANVGLAGLIIALTGLGGMVTTGLGKWWDYRLNARRMDDWEAKANGLAAELATTQAELAESRENAHRRANDTNAILMDVREQVGKNTSTVKAVVPVVQELADRSGVMAAIPEPGTIPDIQTIQ